MLFNKIGMENEVSIARSNFFPIIGEAFDDSKYRESDFIFEFHLRPVKFANERNLIRRFLSSGWFSFYQLNPNSPISFRNFRGEWSHRGESNHLHISLHSELKADKYFQITEKVNSLLPLLQRERVFRDTIKDRAYPVRYAEDFEEEFGIDEEDYENEIWDSKLLACTINTDVNTFEVRINENPVAVPFLLLFHFLLDKKKEPFNYKNVEWNAVLKGYNAVYNREYTDWLISKVKEAITYYHNNKEFSAQGRVYSKTLEIYLQCLIENYDEIHIANQQFFIRLNNWFRKIDSRWNNRISKLEKFHRDLLDLSDESIALLELYDSMLKIMQKDYGKAFFSERNVSILTSLLEEAWRIIARVLHADSEFYFRNLI